MRSALLWAWLAQSLYPRVAESPQLPVSATMLGGRCGATGSTSWAGSGPAQPARKRVPATAVAAANRTGKVLMANMMHPKSRPSIF